MNNPDSSEEIPAPKSGVSPDLIKKLHAANQRFHGAGEQLDKAVDAEVNSLSQRKQATQEVKEAEKQVEKVEEKIQEELKKPIEAS